MQAENILLKELDQQYQQYRHLDNLRERYVAFYIALITAVFLYLREDFAIFILLIIGLFVLEMSILIRIAQRMTADHLMEIKKDLLKMLDTEQRTNVLNSFLMATYKPHESYKGVQRGWDYKESAIQLIFLLIVINSVIGAYLIIAIMGANLYLSNFVFILLSCLVFVLLMYLQLLHFVNKFCSGLSPTKRKERKANMCKYLKNEIKLSDINCDQTCAENNNSYDVKELCLILCIIGAIVTGYFIGNIITLISLGPQFDYVIMINIIAIILIIIILFFVYELIILFLKEQCSES